MKLEEMAEWDVAIEAIVVYVGSKSKDSIV
jgi:hypothetical protein